MSLEIMAVVPEDKKDIVALFNSEKNIWPWGMGVPWYRFWNSRGRTERWHKAVLDGKTVGSVHWSITLDNTRNLYDIVTAPSVRGQGVGRALVEYIGTPVKLKTDVGAPSNDFYLRLGFTKGETEITRSGKKYVTTYYKEHTPVHFPQGTPHLMTYTGRILNPLNITLDDIVIEDIAHGLATCNRFAGQAIKPIPVAQHSVCVARLCEGPNALQALLHDASEAYLGDMTHWLKNSPEMAPFREIEDRTQRVIFEKFGCALDMAPEVIEADRLMVRFEAPRAFGKSWQGFNHPLYDMPITAEEEERIGKWAPLNWRAAEDGFLAHFRQLERLARLAT